jgi:hypothetical protein
LAERVAVLGLFPALACGIRLPRHFADSPFTATEAPTIPRMCKPRRYGHAACRGFTGEKAGEMMDKHGSGLLLAAGLLVSASAWSQAAVAITAEEAANTHDFNQN